MIDVNWSALKSFVNSRNLSIQYVDFNGNYHLRAYDGIFQLGTILPKSNPAAEGSDQEDFEDNFKAKGNISLATKSPFSSKTFGTKKLFKRIHGISSTVAQGSNNILFTIPYAWVKITGIQIVGGENSDSISMMVLDSTTGTYSTIPNHMLNQFGFTVNVTKDNYIYNSEYDADLYQNMQIKIVYSSASSKTIGVNFILNEMK